MATPRALRSGNRTSGYSAHMSERRGELAGEDRALMVRAARHYYLDDMSKMQTADALGVSRFKVARLLEGARELGIVRITVNDAGVPVPELAAAVALHLGLERAIVVEASGGEAEVRREVGAAAADLL